MISQPAPLLIRELGSFHIGGELLRLSGLPLRERGSISGGPVRTVDPNGDIAAGQMYVQYVRLAQPRAGVPVLMWHGGGMSGVNWETTPDGREGRQMQFLRAGLDVLVCDAVERGRAAWAPYPSVYTSERFFRTCQEAWEETFRFGPPGSWHRDPALRSTHPGLRFPVGAIEQFMKQCVPRWTTNEQAAQAAYDALIAHVGGSIVIAHSQGAAFALRAAAAAPDHVRAVVVLDATGAPDPSQVTARSLRGVPHLFVWGDFIAEHPFWVASVPNVRRWYDALRSEAVDAEWVDLPVSGVHGNSHALMMDDNQADIADLVLNWLKDRNLLAGD